MDLVVFFLPSVLVAAAYVVAEVRDCAQPGDCA